MIDERRKLLIELLRDQDAPLADRDDAAMDLENECDDDDTLKAFLDVAQNPQEDDFILDRCGEAIGTIWIKRNTFDLKTYLALPKFAQDGVYYSIKYIKPAWITEFNLT